MNSAWFRKPWTVRAVLHLLVAGVLLGLPLAGEAQTVVNVVSVAGGSSALLGEFTTTPPNLYRQGPVPQAIEDSPFAITGYRPAGAPDSGSCPLAWPCKSTNPPTTIPFTKPASGS